MVTYICHLQRKKLKNNLFTTKLKPGNHILLSENSWTDNKLCIE